MQGTTAEQDNRFSDKEKKLLKQLKFGDCLSQRVSKNSMVTISLNSKIFYFKVDMTKVKLDVIKPWIMDKITEILHIEDDVIVEFVYNQLEERVNIHLIFK